MGLRQRTFKQASSSGPKPVKKVATVVTAMSAAMSTEQPKMPDEIRGKATDTKSLSTACERADLYASCSSVASFPCLAANKARHFSKFAQIYAVRLESAIPDWGSQSQGVWSG